MVQHLVETLQAQLEIYAGLLETAKDKKRFIIKNDIPAIQRATARENGLIGRLKGAERERGAAAADVARRLGVPSEGLTLAELIKHVSDPKARRQLEELRSRLRTGMDELKELNERNKSLINQSLEYIEFTVNLLRGAVAGPVFAGAEDVCGRALFDAKG